MTTIAATIAAALTLDKSQYDAGMASAKKNAEDFKAKFEKVGKKLQGVGAIMSLGVTAPIIAGMSSMAKAASDLGEAQNAVNVVFGDSKSIITDFAQTSATQVGLAKSDFMQLGATMGSMLQNFGLDANLAAEETINLTKRAADMASIFNTDVEGALSAVKSALAGESEPMKKYGVDVSAAAVAAKAFAMGLIEEGDALDQKTKTLATMALIYEKTDRFAGDFVATSDQLANGTRALKAQVKDLSAEMGENLLPILLDVMTGAGKIIDWFSKLDGGTQRLTLVLLGLAAAAGPVLGFIGTLITMGPALIAAAGAIGGVLLAIAGAPILPIIAGLVILGATIKIIIDKYNSWKNKDAEVTTGIAHARAVMVDATVAEMDRMSTSVDETYQKIGSVVTEADTAALAQRQEVYDMQMRGYELMKISAQDYAASTIKDYESVADAVDGRLTAAILGTADASAEATKRILYDLATQRAAVDGLSEAEEQFLSAYAEKLGIVDQATLLVGREMDKAFRLLAEAETLSMAGFADEAAIKFAAANEILDKITANVLAASGMHSVDFLITVYGQLPDFQGMSFTNPEKLGQPGYVPPKTPVKTGGRKDKTEQKAHGGRVDRGETYLVGELGMELFTPDSNGTITSNANLGKGSNPPIINIYPATNVDVEAAAQTIAERISRRR